MITGYNTEVKRGGRVYHVQTEDKGVKNPVIETLVYVDGGQIIHSKQYSYEGLVEGDSCDERAVGTLVESQHRRVMRWIAGGKFDEDGPPPFGSTIVSDRSFDEVALEFIREQEVSEPIEVVLAEEMRPVPGKEVGFRLLVRGTGSRAPAPGARVTITLNPRLGKTRKMAAGTVSEDGILEGKMKIPADAAGGFLQVEAQSGKHVGALEIPLPSK
jgi:hypothetical protein